MANVNLNQEDFEKFKNIDTYFISDELKKDFEKYRFSSYDLLTEDEIKRIHEIIDSAGEKQLQYSQKYFFKLYGECIDSYIQLKEAVPLLNSFFSLVFMDFRTHVGQSLDFPTRYKSSESMLKNVDKELKKILEDISLDTSHEEIDSYVKKAIDAVVKDFFGATLVFNNLNDINPYCKQAIERKAQLQKEGQVNTQEFKELAELEKLYTQFQAVEYYINQSEKLNNSKGLKKILWSINPPQIDISDTFIDKDIVLPVQRRVTPLNKKIETKREYYEQLIALLTLSANLSIPYRDDPNSESKYIVSETDMSYLRLVKSVRANNPKNKDDALEQLTALARETYFKPYKSFDVQLTEALKAQKEAKSSRDYNQLLDPKDRIKLTQHIEHLIDNLNKIKKDRLLNYISEIETPKLIDKLSDLPNINVEVVEEKEKNKLNGFHAKYYILLINSIAKAELQTYSETRSDISKEGNSSHNASIPGKNFNIRHLFELNPNNSDPFTKDKLETYCAFLETVNINDVKADPFTNSNPEDLAFLQDLIKYAKSRIKVKDKIKVDGYTSPKGKKGYMDFDIYINRLLELYGADFFSLSRRAGAVENNQVQDNPQNKLYSLEMLLKNRVGLSELANMIRENYKRISSEKGDEILPQTPIRAYSYDFVAKYDIPRENKRLKRLKSKYEKVKTEPVLMTDRPIKPLTGGLPVNSQEESDNTQEENTNIEQEL